MRKLLSFAALVVLLIVATASPAQAAIRWGGYSKYGSPSNSAAADIKVPTITCNTGDNGKTVAGWVGVDDGFYLSQTGFTAFCSGTTESYGLWYEVYPAPPHSSSVTVSPGNTIRVAVFVNSDHVLFTITNRTTGASATHTVNMAAPQAGVRHWIVEDGIGGQVAPKFTQVTFTRAAGFPGGLTKVVSDPPFNVGAIQSCSGTCQSFWVRDSR